MATACLPSCCRESRELNRRKSFGYRQRWTIEESDFKLEELPLSGYVHGEPADDMWCLAMAEEITSDTFCEYQTSPSGTWHPSNFSAEAVQRLICTQFGDFIRSVRNATCEADLKKRLDCGPPIWLEDQHAMPLPFGDTHICRVWMLSDGKEYSAKLKGCVEGAERDALWKELKAFTPVKRSEKRLTRWWYSSRRSRGSGSSSGARASASTTRTGASDQRGSRGSPATRQVVVTVEGSAPGAVGVGEPI